MTQPADPARPLILRGHIFKESPWLQISVRAVTQELVAARLPVSPSPAKFPRQKLLESLEKFSDF
jgi:hypothetical protein